MKCKKCNASLIASPFNRITGYQAYRCSACNSLFDIVDLSNQDDNLLLKEMILSLEDEIGKNKFSERYNKCFISLGQYYNKHNKFLSEDIIFDKNIMNLIQKEKRLHLPENFVFDSYTVKIFIII